MIFVFGSNLDGRHGKGAAKTAFEEYGARKGVVEGLTGRSYALPTCDHLLILANGRKCFPPLSLDEIGMHINRFAYCVWDHPNTQFQVTRVGCGLGGYRDEDIAPLFTGAPKNVFFDAKWEPYLGETHEYWGSY